MTGGMIPPKFFERLLKVKRADTDIISRTKEVEESASPSSTNETSGST
jgi:hypothetical protein